jgi:hypothetical protein
VVTEQPGRLPEKLSTEFVDDVTQQTVAGVRSFHCNCVMYMRLLVRDLLRGIEDDGADEDDAGDEDDTWIEDDVAEARSG